jgi:3-deoxy-7-phosphoheptulonate synthase/chorismate mutase
LSADPDPVIRDLREQISAADRAVLEAVNRRLELVAELKRYKESQGIAFVDPERERAMLEHFARANGGPLSDEGVRELMTMLLDLTKREVD